MFTVMNMACGFQHHVLRPDEKFDIKDSKVKWNIIAAICADIIAGLALLVVGVGILTAIRTRARDETAHCFK